MNDTALPVLARRGGACDDELVCGGSEPAWARSAEMRQVLAALDRVAPTRTAVLLVGETGIGKDWLAQLLHRKSGRAGQFRAIACAELIGERLDQVLPSPHDSSFSAVGGGTLLLQELAALSHEGQIRLVEWLDAIDPPGGIDAGWPAGADLRIIASSTVDLARSVHEGAFLPGLYFRLAAAELRIPPLRERKEDIEGLVAILLSELEQKYDLGPFVVTDALLEALRGAPWPGNVRQLRAVLQRAILLSTHELLDQSLLPTDWAFPADPGPFEVRVGTALAEVERRLILETLRASGGHRLQTARALGISRRKLHYRLRQYRDEGLPV